MGLLIPSAVVTVRSRGPGTALAAIVKVAVADVGLVTFTLLTVMPLPASIVIGEMKRVPVRVTFMVAPGWARNGVKAVRVGVLIDRLYLPPAPSSSAGEVVASIR